MDLTKQLLAKLGIVAGAATVVGGGTYAYIKQKDINEIKEAIQFERDAMRILRATLP